MQNISVSKKMYDINVLCTYIYVLSISISIKIFIDIILINYLTATL